MTDNEIKKTKLLKQSLKSYKSRPVEYFDELNSTNTYLTDKAKRGERIEDRTLVVAGKQTNGKGRMGRNFHSPEHSGIYMSIFFKGERASFSPETPALLTVIAGTAVCETLNELTGCSFFIKWVNDVMWKDKKVCGILAETKISSFPHIDYTVLGIGINTEPSRYPDDIKDKAISVNEVISRSDVHPRPPVHIPKEKIISEILRKTDEMWDFCISSGITSPVMERYENRLGIIGKKVNIIHPATNVTYPAKVIGITPEANLIVEDENKTRHILNSGEISLKLP